VAAADALRPSVKQVADGLVYIDFAMKIELFLVR